MTDAALSQPTICTIFAKNYLAHVRVLTESFLEQHPDGRVYALLCDQLADAYAPERERFHTVQLSDIGLPGGLGLAMQYNITEFCTAVKPFLLRYLFDSTPAQTLFYFDPDILFAAPINGLLERLQTFNIVLTPHLTAGYDDDRTPTEHDILATGAYNLGFIGLRRGEVGDAFLAWWSRKLLKHGYHDITHNQFVDQRWVDLAPGMYAGVYIERDPGCNVAYWSLPQRLLVRTPDGYTANGSPLKFFHFSGYSPLRPDEISKYQNRLSIAQLGNGEGLFQQYAQLLAQQGYECVRQWPYAYNRLSNGAPVSAVVRELWAEASEAGKQWDDPFDAQSPGSFYQWMIEPIDAGLPVINRVARHAYEKRLDIQPIFPDIQKVYRRAYAEWFIKHGLEELELAPELAANMIDSLRHSPPAPVMARATAWLRARLLQSLLPPQAE